MTIKILLIVLVAAIFWIVVIPFLSELLNRETL